MAQTRLYEERISLGEGAFSVATPRAWNQRLDDLKFMHSMHPVLSDLMTNFPLPGRLQYYVTPKFELFDFVISLRSIGGWCTKLPVVLYCNIAQFDDTGVQSLAMPWRDNCQSS
jgi:hypothetical protein